MQYGSGSGATTIKVTGLEGTKSFLAAMEPEFPKALSIAINAGVNRTRAEAWREVSARYGIKQAAFYKRFFKYTATAARLTGRIFVAQTPAVGLHEYKTSITQKGVKVTVTKATGAKLIEGSFHMVDAKNNPVFLRKHRRRSSLSGAGRQRLRSLPWKQMQQAGRIGKEARLPILKLYSLSAAQLMDDGTIRQRLEIFGADVMRSELDRQIDRLIRL